MATSKKEQVLFSEEISTDEEDLDLFINGEKQATAELPVTCKEHLRIGHSLSWSQTNLSVSNKRSGGKVAILKNAYGRLEPFRLSAVMGLSGSGKTSLLNVLSGRVSRSSDMELSHDIRLDGNRINPSSWKDQFAYVEQHDTLLSTATAREAIEFSARLRLGRPRNDSEIATIVGDTLACLKLHSVADTLIGSQLLPGLSGGERRRVSLGVELVTSPKIIFADEVTSGLDSASAVHVIEALKHLANQGSSIMVTIHQPDSQIFSLFDDLTLMHLGHTLFSGPTADIADYFGSRGFQLPTRFNTADVVISVARSFKKEADIIDKGFAQDFPATEAEEEKKRGFTGCDDFNLEHGVNDIRVLKVQAVLTKPNIGGPRWQLVFSELMKRQARSFLRNSHLMKLRFTMAVLGGLLVAIFMTGVAAAPLDEGIAALQSHIGGCFLVIMCVIVSTQVVMLDFVEQRPLFEHEYSRNFYGILGFSLSQLTFETVSVFVQILTYFLIVYVAVGFQGDFFLLFACLWTFSMVCGSIGVAIASLVRDPASAKELIPVTVLPQLLLCGFFVAPGDVPRWLQWASWCAPLTYTYRIFINEEFRFCNEAQQDQVEIFTCLGVLGQSGFDVGSDDGSWLTNETTMVFPQYGTYKGKESINEYLALYGAPGATDTGLVDSCGVEKTARVVDYDVNTPGYCDVTFGTITKTRLNDAITSLGENEIMEFVYGVRVQFPLSGEADTKDELVLDQISIYYHTEHLKTLNGAVDHEKAVDQICTTMENSCGAVFKANGFRNKAQCADQMQTIPPFEDFNGEIYDDGNTTGCRTVHMFLAQQNDDHCPHISYLPMEDKNGFTKCSKSNYLNQTDYFSAESFQGFDEIAESYGMDPAYPINIVNRDQAGQCTYNIQQDLIASFYSTAGPEAACQAYLVEQKALSSYRGQYWGTLLLMVVCIRVLGAVLLQLRVRR